MFPSQGGPAGLLAELTHRCPLQCPYCSNPLEMERAAAEIERRGLGRRVPSGRRDGRAAIASLRRRADRAARPAENSRACRRGGALHQPDHRRRAADARALSTAGRHRPRPCPGLGPGRRARECRPHLRLQGRPPKKRDVARWARELGLGLTINAPMHRQNIAHLPAIIDFALQARRAAHRGRAYPVLRLGRQEPRRADPHARESSKRPSASSTRRRRASTACSPSTSSFTTITPSCRRPAWADGRNRSSSLRPRAACCPAMPRRPCPA